MSRYDRLMRYAAYVIAMALIGVLMATARAQDLPPTSAPQDPPHNEVTNKARLWLDVRVTDAVRLEARAVSLLKGKAGLTTAQAKAMLRPRGELDQQLCVEVIINARVGVTTDGFTALATLIERLPTTSPVEGGTVP